jgi:hypothetical protein
MTFSWGVPVAARPRHPSPIVTAVFVEGARGMRAVFGCRPAGPDTVVELDKSLAPFGATPTGGRAAAAVGRHEGLVTCVEDGQRGALRLRPLQIRAVTPSLAGDAAGARLVLAVDGQALGPRIAQDDDVYLVWRGAIVAAAEVASPTCPEARWTDERVVVCLDLVRLRGRGAARVRVQAAGRLEEAAGAPLDLARAARLGGEP